MSKKIGFSQKDPLKLSVILGGMILLGLLIVIIMLSVNGNKKTMVEPTQTKQNTLPPTEMVATLPATPTQLPLTPTQVAPTPTEVLPLAVAENGLQIRCLPVDYENLPIDTADAYFDSSVLVRQSAPMSDGIEITVPARACAVFVQFNQSLPVDAQLEIYQLNDTKAWYTRPLIEDGFTENSTFAVLNHEYLTNPPYWTVIYTMKITALAEPLWECSLIVNRVFNNLCWEGSIPDPVTLSCPLSDPLEREPHPDMPTLVTDGIEN